MYNGSDSFYLCILCFIIIFPYMFMDSKEYRYLFYLSTGTGTPYLKV